MLDVLFRSGALRHLRVVGMVAYLPRDPRDVDSDVERTLNLQPIIVLFRNRRNLLRTCLHRSVVIGDA